MFLSSLYPSLHLFIRLDSVCVCSIYIQAGGHEHGLYTRQQQQQQRQTHIHLYSGYIRLLLLLSRSPSFVCCTTRSFLPTDADFFNLALLTSIVLSLPGKCELLPFFSSMFTPQKRKKRARIANKKFINIKQSRFKREIKVIYRKSLFSIANKAPTPV